MESKTEVKMVEWFNDHWYKITQEILTSSGEPLQQVIHLPSTTTKLGIVAKPFLAKWRGDIGNREADMRLFESSERGVRIHHGWYTLTTQGVVLYNPPRSPNYSLEEINEFQEQNLGNVAIIKYQDEMYDIWKLKKWVEIVKPKFLYSELIVYSLTQKDAGTTDNVMLIEAGEYLVNGAQALVIKVSGNYLVDLKSGKEVDDNAYMQTADYAKCYEEMGLGEIQGTLILHTGAKTRKGIEGLATHLRTKEQMEQDYIDFRHAAALWERKNADAKPDVFEFPALLTLKGENNGSDQVG